MNSNTCNERPVSVVGRVAEGIYEKTRESLDGLRWYVKRVRGREVVDGV